jgi:hypothetical protein
MSFIIGKPQNANSADSEAAPEQVGPSDKGKANSSKSYRSSHAVCVKLCDGSYFPLSGAGGDTEGACSRQCPGAPTQVYFLASDQIDTAVSSDGRPYTALPAAFHYRSAFERSCACGARDARESASALLGDPTLRKGDMVMTTGGIRVFRGGSVAPYGSTDFLNIAQSSLPRAEHDELIAIDREAVRSGGEQK